MVLENSRTIHADEAFAELFWMPTQREHNCVVGEMQTRGWRITRQNALGQANCFHAQLSAGPIELFDGALTNRHGSRRRVDVAGGGLQKHEGGLVTERYRTGRQ